MWALVQKQKTAVKKIRRNISQSLTPLTSFQKMSKHFAVCGTLSYKGAVELPKFVYEYEYGNFSTEVLLLWPFVAMFGLQPCTRCSGGVAGDGGL